ncbi:MAG: hypothetical protein AABX05_04155 [Nanoarchaeota archaeon]
MKFTRNLELIGLVAALNGCGDTNNYYVGGDGNGDGQNTTTSYTCEEAADHLIYECHVYDGDPHLNGPYYDLPEVLLRECQVVPFPDTWKECVLNASCEQLLDSLVIIDTKRYTMCSYLLPSY